MESPAETTPPLFFAVSAYAERDVRLRDNKEAFQTRVLAAEGRRFLARQLGPCIVFRLVEQASANEAEAFYLLRDRRVGVSLETLDDAAFAAQIAQGAYGRCFAYQSREMKTWECIYVLIAPSGTGEGVLTAAWERHKGAQIVPFRWNQEADGRALPEVLTMQPTPDAPGALAVPGANLRPALDAVIDTPAREAFCEAAFRLWINPKLADPFVGREEFDRVRFTFECGSWEELQRVTIAACHVEPDLFDNGVERLMVSYWSKSPDRPTQSVRITRGDQTKLRRNVLALCELAVRHNAFSGAQFISGWALNRRSHSQTPDRRLVVSVAAPSMHERAEALLVLHEWLEGKVSDKRRAQLLNLNP